MIYDLCSWLCLTQVLVADVKVLPVLFKNLLDPENCFSDQSCKILSNLTRHEKTCKTVFPVSHLKASHSLTPPCMSCVTHWTSKDDSRRSHVCLLLSVLDNDRYNVSVLSQVLQEEVGLTKVVELFCTEGFNKKANLHYLGPLLSNLTQLPEARKYILDKDRWLNTLQEEDCGLLSDFFK